MTKIDVRGCFVVILAVLCCCATPSTNTVFVYHNFVGCSVVQDSKVVPLSPMHLLNPIANVTGGCFLDTLLTVDSTT